MKFKQLITSASMQSVRNVLAALLLFATTTTASAQAVEADTLEVRFRLGLSDLDLSFGDNERRINEFVASVKQHFANAPKNSLKMDIYGGASPEGPNELNRRLGEQRGIALKEVLMQRLSGIIDQITVINQGARWGGLYSMIEKSNEPWKYDVLEVLTKTPENDGWQVDPREQKLRKMKKGTIWNQLLAKYLPTLRSSGSAVVAPMSDFEKKLAGITDDRGYCDTLVIRDTVIYLPEPCPAYEEPIDSDWVWALKTNFLLWGVIAPNAQIEFPLGRSNRWSIEGEVFWPWYIWAHNAKAHQCGNLGLELRYWLGNRKKHHTLDGWHIGLGAGVGYYDFEWKKHEGYQGEYLNIYFNFGYQHRWGKRKQWAIDAGLGFGWIPTKYREYLGSSIFPVGHEEEYDDHLMWQKSSSKHIFGATHANITLGYMFHTKSKKKTETITEAPEPIAPVSYAATPSQSDEKAAKAAAKEKAKADKAAAKRAAQEAKDAEKAEKAAAKAAKEAEKGKADADKAAEKAAKEAAKEKAAADKAAEKAAKEAAKEKAAADKAAEKAAEKAAKEAAKEKAAADKAAEKAAKAAAKEAEKAAKARAKAEIEAEKAAKKAAKAN